MMRKTKLIVLLNLIFFTSFAQIPTGYYDTATGTGAALKTQLYNIIKNPGVPTYTELWTAFQSTDVDIYYENDGTVLDMYSEKPVATDPYNFTFVTDQCGTYTGESSCYNREHSFPKSWFASATPMYSDLFHLYPTDGYVNGIRSNLPYGPNNGEGYISQNGSKKGVCTAAGYSGTVFEPIDEFKGDLARTYFYMATCYENVITGWTSDVLDGTSFPVYNTWYLNIMLQWHTQDPVSQKEIDRNDAVYGIQGNRNPFIDHPEWVECIWNNNCGVQNPDNFTAVAFSETQINLAWILNAANDNIVLAFNTTNTFGTPTGTYTAGNTISGGGEVLFVGNATSFSHTGLINQVYYYKIWSVNAANEYSSGITASSSPLLAEPTNSVTNFIVSNETSNTISLTWTDATGGQLPEAYLIKASTGGITPPVDGTPEADAQFVKNIAYGTETVTFTGLTPSTTYFFEIYPYTNSGSNINYKTNTVESAIGNTLVGSSEIINENFATCLPTGWTTYSVSGLNDWSCDVGGFVYVNAYNSDVACNDWLISPAVNLDIYGSELLTFTTYTRYTDGGITDPEVRLKYSADYSGSGDPQLASWTEIPYSFPLEDSQAWTVSGDVDVSAVNGTSVYFAFVYTSSGTGAGTSTLWQVDDVLLTGSLLSTNDSDSEVSAPTSQIAASTISSLLDTEIEAVDVFSFNIQDSGTSDALQTEVLNMRIYPGSSNTADWTDCIQSVLLNDGANISISSLSITDTYINIQTAPVVINDGSLKTITMSLYLNTSNIIDGTVLSFMIDANNHGFVADGQFSTFSTVINGGSDILSNDFTVDVGATELVFSQEPGNTLVNVAMNPTVKVKAVDINGNTDVDFNTAITISSTGTMSNDPVSGTWTLGSADFSNIIHTETGTGLQLTATSGTFSLNSALFDIFCTPVDAANLNVTCGQAQSEISWSNSSCYDEVIIVVNDASITGTPAGTYVANSTDYTDVANPDFPGGGKVVYNGTVSPQTITGLTNGTNYYFKTFVNSFGLWSTGTETTCTTVNVEQTNSTFKLYPNPVNDLLTVENSFNGIYLIELIDVTGKSVFKSISESNYFQLNVNSYPKGLYLIKISSSDIIYRQKVIIE
ncbi:MAG: endonuclease [Bacteroidales bacterium]|nr:endonuclease [Bacteroidales bacterium]